MLNKIKKYIKHKVLVSKTCIKWAHASYQEGNNFDAFMFYVEHLLALSMVPYLSWLFELYIVTPLCLTNHSDDDE